jgi:hypothetical protein
MYSLYQNELYEDEIATQVVPASELIYILVLGPPSVLKYREPIGAVNVGAPDPKHTIGAVGPAPTVNEYFPPAVIS